MQVPPTKKGFAGPVQGRRRCETLCDSSYCAYTIDDITINKEISNEKEGEKMEDNHKRHCKHKYVVGYSFRIPEPFFRSLLCDNCGCRIKLNLQWRIIYWLINILGFLLVITAADRISKFIDIRVFGTTFWMALLICIPLFWIIQMVERVVLKYGKWIEYNEK